MNKIVLTGNVCRDIEVYKYNDKSCVKNSIAVKRDFKNKDGNYDTDFFNITLWGTQADFVKNYAVKGDKIIVSGHLINNEFELEDGTKKSSNDIVVEGIELLSKKEKTKTDDAELSTDNVETKPVDEDDLFD